MNRDEFLHKHWKYYLMLEADFILTERFLTFDLGDSENSANGQAYSNEFVKQYQTICSEIDVILKTICNELGHVGVRTIDQYAEKVLRDSFWQKIVPQKVKVANTELSPFIEWKLLPEYKSPDWWSSYNKVKHDRVKHLREANLKNVMNALAALYILENYLVKYITDKTHDTCDVPNDISHLFEMLDWRTNSIVIGKDMYLAMDSDIEGLF